MEVTRPVSSVRKYLLLLRAAYRAQLQYRGNLILTLAGGVAFQGIGFAFIWVIVERFGSLAGWGMPEISFLYGMRLVSHGLAVVPMNQLDYIALVVRTAEFDRYLIRPAGILTQLLTRQLHLPTIGDLCTGLAILLFACSRLRLDWSAMLLAYLFLALIGGALVEAAVQLFIASFSFRFLSNQSLMFLLDRIMNDFGGYPMKIFPSGVRFMLTFVVPLAFVSYIPVDALLHQAGSSPVSRILMLSAPLVGPLLFWLSYSFWKNQLRHYSSSGS
ncbi:ABC transporter permease [Streptomyces sp. NPDC058319]|uniref:ABC transporter permease n=1 Tax=unclassified Streptomyces TaxID=2593676 RepID=UPI0036E77812